ncbi:MAG TPA: NADH-quinone oxidoreductase subunit J, partial [Archangium sp.]|nr:NADH-quinone oxidoreductase subunit J [Archangium sp.]
MNVELVLFGAFALLTLLSAGLVIFAKSAISSAMSLVATFFFLAGIYVLLWAHTVAVLQVLVYAGAIMVLFLFVIMLLNLGEEAPGPRLTLGRIAGGAASAGL